MANLTQTFGGITFKSPIVVAAGPLTERYDLIKKAAEAGAGALVIKQTPFSEPRPGVRKMYAEKGGFFFNPSDRRLNYNKCIDLIKRVKNDIEMPILVNILGDGTDIETWLFLVEKLQEAGADGVELNFACPNAPEKIGDAGAGFQYGASVSQNPDMAKQIISGITKEAKIPVWVKFSGDGTDTAMLCKNAEKSGASGVVAFCSPKGAFPIDIYNGGCPKMAAMDVCSFGGINGTAIRPSSLRVIAQAAKACDRIPVCGGGGISKPEHAIEAIMYGASLTFMFTHIMLEGFGCIPKFNEFILKFMEEQGYKNIPDMRGLALKYEVPNSELDYAMGPKAKVDETKCVGCGVCSKIAFCRAIEFAENKAKICGELCESCGLCASLCPRSAISF